MIPTNEQETIIKFVREMPEDWEILGFRTHKFPDADIKIGHIVYRVEFEYISKNFQVHGHDPKGCDFIVCWKDDWDEACIPIIELNKFGWQDMMLKIAVGDEIVIYLRSLIQEEKERRHELKEQLKLLQEKSCAKDRMLEEISREMAIKNKGSNVVGRPLKPLGGSIVSKAIIAWLFCNGKPAYSTFAAQCQTSFPRAKAALGFAREILDELSKIPEVKLTYL